jgi:neutral ceramidase
MSQADSTSFDEELLAGAASVDITPPVPCFLHGYPGIARYSVGVHDPLECSALWLESNGQVVLLLACDVIYVGKAIVARVRDRISKRLPVPAHGILISATHTHSGPVMVDLVSEHYDSLIPKPDPTYLQILEDAMMRAALAAFEHRQPAESGWSVADATGIGTNRHDPSGPADLAVPVFGVRAKSDHQPLAIMLVCTMHPTVLHEDSILVSGDFLGIARQQLRQQLGVLLPVLIHLGACGNQSPRHVTTANTFPEAERIARLLSLPVQSAFESTQWSASLPISVASEEVELSLRDLPDITSARIVLQTAEQTLAMCRADGSPPTRVRSAECDLFGAQTTFRLAKTHAENRLASGVAESRMAEVMVIRLGGRRIVAWPGEWFVEFQIGVKNQFPDCVVMTMANGELQGYIVTEEAVCERWYEAGNAVFDARSTAARVLALTERLLQQAVSA